MFLYYCLIFMILLYMYIFYYPKPLKFSRLTKILVMYCHDYCAVKVFSVPMMSQSVQRADTLTKQTVRV